MTELLVPAAVAGAAVYALYRQVNVFPVFLCGVKKGLHTAIQILPTIIAMLTAVTMLRASGFIDLAGQFLSPLLTAVGIPQECAALMLLKPLSGSGGLALGSEIMQRYGTDSIAGQCAAVMLSASETSLYTIGIYCGHLGLKRTGYVIPAALIADLTAFLMSAWCVRAML